MQSCFTTRVSELLLSESVTKQKLTIHEVSTVMSRFSDLQFSALNTGDGAWSQHKYAISI